MILDLREGGFVHVRFEIRRAQPSQFDRLLARMRCPSSETIFSNSYDYLWVPRSQIICREPETKFADDGAVRAI